MRPAAPLAFALRSSEADHGRKLGPVDGVEPAIAGMDRHQGLTCVWGVCVRTTLGDFFSFTPPPWPGFPHAGWEWFETRWPDCRSVIGRRLLLLVAMARGGVITPEHPGDGQPAFRVALRARLRSCGLRQCVNHSFIASVQASQWGGVAYSPAIRPRPLGPRQGGAFLVAGGRRRRRSWAAPGPLLCAMPLLPPL